MVKFDSTLYWENRYKNGGNSGDGSRGVLAEYKANIINKFVKDNNIQTVYELGCGDFQFTLYDVPNFTGFDVSEFIIEMNKKNFKHKFTSIIDDNEFESYDLTLSLDVVYHLIDDDVYYQHMKDLFNLSKKYVMIYSPNRDEIFSEPHNRYREFLKDVPYNFELIQIIDNPHKGNLTQSDFFIFKHV